MLKSRQLRPPFAIETFCFKEQIDFIHDKRQFKTAVCSRRSGKTVACAADLIDTALKHSNVVCLYITLKRVNAKRIIWPELLRINREYQLGGIPNESDLSIKFPNGSVIYCSGAKDKSEIENFRGLALKKVYIDECQSFRPHIEELIDDVISKALFDYAGQLCLIGTPGMVPAGYFYNCSTSDSWAHHAWTMFNNPYLERKSGRPVLALILDDCKRMGVEITHPKIQRECYGRWVTDLDSLVFKYSAEKNHYGEINDARDFEFVIGVDVGFDDADAIAVIGWHRHRKRTYLIHEEVKTKQGITELSEQLDALIKQYDPLKVVMDTGGLGKKIAEEMRKRYTLPIVAAEKSRKFEFIELLNDAMRTERFFAKKTGRFAQDALLVEWDRDKSTPDKLVVSEGYHSDVCFTAGTLIETDAGQIEIENIRPGMMAMTRTGPQRVLSAGMTSASAGVMHLRFSNGSELVCTPNHPIYTLNRGFVSADALLYADSCVISPRWQNERSHKPKSLSSMARGLLDIRTHAAQHIGITIAATSAMVAALVKKPCFTGQFGSTTTAISRTDTTSIIGTGTHSITRYRTSNAYQHNSTTKRMLQTERYGAGLEESKNTWPRFGASHQHGTGPKPEGSGTKVTPLSGKNNIELGLKRSVPCVTRCICAIRSLIARCFIAPISAARVLVGLLAKTTKGAFARTVQRGSWSINTQKSDFAAARVVSQIPIGCASVYNLTVDKCPEYYANGVLVHNCDAVLYAYREALHWLTEPEPVKLNPLTPKWFAAQEKEMENAAQEALRRAQGVDDMWDDMGWDQ